MEVHQIQEALNTKAHAVIGVTSGTAMSIWSGYLQITVTAVTIIYVTTLVINQGFIIYKNFKNFKKKK